MRSLLIALCLLASLAAQESGAGSRVSISPKSTAPEVCPSTNPNAATPENLTLARLRATRAALAGDLLAAEAHQLQALAACRACPVEHRAVLRAELAAYHLHAGFPQAAVAQWKHALAELGPRHPWAAPARIGLGAALHAAGKTAEARATWAAVCPHPGLTPLEAAACRFHLRPEWSEIETLLPTLLEAPHPLARLTVLLTAAELAPPARAASLLREARRIADAELGPRHPLRAHLKHADKPRFKPRFKPTNKPTVSLEELKEKPRP